MSQVKNIVYSDEISILSESQVNQYVDDGFIVVDNLIRPDELSDIGQEILRIAKNKLEDKSVQYLSDEELLKRILAINTPHYISDVFKTLVSHQKICSVLAQIAGAHFAHWTGNVKAMYSILFIKPPGFQGQAWHQDESYIPSRDRSLTAAFVAIDDITIENGCLWLIPGSHQTGYMYPSKPHGNLDEYDFNDESYGFDESTMVPLEMKAGSVAFFNGYMLHKSFKNSSDTYRRSLVVHYMGAESLAPWMGTEIGEPVARADNRKILPVFGKDPYEWKGYDDFGDESTVRTCKKSIEISRKKSS